MNESWFSLTGKSNIIIWQATLDYSSYRQQYIIVSQQQQAKKWFWILANNIFIGFECYSIVSHQTREEKINTNANDIDFNIKHPSDLFDERSKFACCCCCCSFAREFAIDHTCKHCDCIHTFARFYCSLGTQTRQLIAWLKGPTTTTRLRLKKKQTNLSLSLLGQQHVI